MQSSLHDLTNLYRKILRFDVYYAFPKLPTRLRCRRGVPRGLRRIILFLEIGRGLIFRILFRISRCRSTIDAPRLAPFRRPHEPHAARRPHLDGSRHSSRGAAATANKGTTPTHSDPQVRTEPSTRLAIIHQQHLTRADWMCVRAVA